MTEELTPRLALEQLHTAYPNVKDRMGVARLEMWMGDKGHKLAWQIHVGSARTPDADTLQRALELALAGLWRNLD